ADLLKEQRGVYKAQQEARHDQSSPSEQTEQLNQLRKDNQSAEKALRDLARDADATPDLDALAEKARGAAAQQMARSEAARRDAAAQKKMAERDRPVGKGDAELTAALKRLEELRQANERLAKERLDRAKLEMLAEREKDLAERAAAQAEKDPVRDP